MPDADLSDPLSARDSRRVPAVEAPDLRRDDPRVTSVVALRTSVEVIV
ncbi:MAG: hypothetical protein PIR02_05005 [Microbacterium enclense]